MYGLKSFVLFNYSILSCFSLSIQSFTVHRLYTRFFVTVLQPSSKKNIYIEFKFHTKCAHECILEWKIVRVFVLWSLNEIIEKVNTLWAKGFVAVACID